MVGQRGDVRWPVQESTVRLRGGASVSGSVDGDEVGSVTEVLHTGAGELLSVRAGEGREVLVPFVSAIVMSVSLTDGVIEIDPPEGLLDLE